MITWHARVYNLRNTAPITAYRAEDRAPSGSGR
jgi:hypothetical protein